RGHVVHAEWQVAQDELRHRGRQIAGEGWCEYLIVNHADGATLGLHTQHRFDEVPPLAARAGQAEQPTHPHDIAGGTGRPHSQLAAEFGDTVHVDRLWTVRLAPGASCFAREDIVSRDMPQPGTGAMAG